MARRVFGGKLINLYLQKKRLPNGYLATLEIVRHPGAVLIVPQMSRDKIVLIRQYRPVIDSYIWELPAGTLHRDEPPLKCAQRELIEEIGYGAKKWRRLGYIYPAPGYTTEKITIFSAQGLERVARQNQQDEVIFPKTFSKRQLRGLMAKGRIVDAKTICALKLANFV